MFEVNYESDKHGVIHGSIGNGYRVILFSLGADTIMNGRDVGLNVLDETIHALIKDLTDFPEG